ncbi:MAG: metallophosphoesterase [Planctomycetota bacterium]|jgi:UDP-2,3-diacylglucosamine pyrophosphatase LpxH
MEKKRIYISDIHMNAGKGFRKAKGQYPYEWLGPDEVKRFADFLNFVNRAKDVQELVIIGDLLDDWVYPVDIVPPSLEDILKAPINRPIVRALKRLTAKKKNKDEEITVLYLPGNHDMGITREMIRRQFPRMIFGGTALYNSVYRSSRLRAEHGSAYAMFNAPDAINSPGNRLPLGYFISRVVATKSRDTGSEGRHYWTYADDLLETLGPQKLPESVLEGVLEEAGLNNETRIRMPKRNGKARYITAGEVKKKYACLYEQWRETYGSGAAFKAMMAEIGFLGNLADRLCKKSDTNIVIFGHSHDWKLDKDKWFVDDRIYANCGTWCDGAKLCTWVESRKDRKKREHTVRVMDWNKGKPKKLKTATVPL